MSSEVIENNNLTKEEKLYNDYIRRGDDFYRIELFRSAKEMYEDALKYKPDDEMASEKIADCRNLIKRDTRRVLLVMPFIIAIVVAVYYCRCN